MFVSVFDFGLLSFSIVNGVVVGTVSCIIAAVAPKKVVPDPDDTGGGTG